MITPNETGQRTNPLSRQEGAELTVALGAAFEGDDYNNADVWGKVLHSGGSNWLEAQRDRDPEAFAAKINTQVDKLQTIIAPYIGRWAAAKHRNLGVKSGSEWELRESLRGSSNVMHTSGIILGVAGVVMDRRIRNNYNHPGKVSEVRASTWQMPDFKIGVLLGASNSEHAFSDEEEAPDTGWMLVPVRGFPRHRESLNWLWSHQLRGIDNLE